MAGFRFLEYGLFIELRSIIRPEGLTLRASAKALFNAAQAPVVRVRAPCSEEPAYGGFRFLEYGLSIELRSIIRPEGLTLRASAKALFNAAQAPVVRVRAPYSEEPAYGGFSLSGVRTLHRTAFDYSAKGLTLQASAEALFNAAQAPVVRVRSPYSEEPAYGGFFAFWSTDSSSNCVRLFGEGLTLRASAKALFNAAQAPVVRVRAPYSE